MIPLIRIKRIYESSLKTDGYRVLVDRLWPRGVTKEKASIDDWAKDLAPTVELRKWFGHTPSLWTAFQKKYKQELKQNKMAHQFLENNKHRKVITLVYAAKDKKHNHAIVLGDFLMSCYGKI